MRQQSTERPKRSFEDRHFRKCGSALKTVFVVFINLFSKEFCPQEKELALKTDNAASSGGQWKLTCTYFIYFFRLPLEAEQTISTFGSYLKYSESCSFSMFIKVKVL